MRLSLRASLAVALTLSVWPSRLAAQSAPQPPPAASPQPSSQQTPTFRTEANFVRVDVYPLKDGHPVTDLTAADFEVFEDGAPQRVDAFEHVVVRPAGPQSERVEPASQREMKEAAANPRNRVFVIFLDTSNVGVSGSHDIGGPLIRLINQILGPDDLVGIMTPDMRAKDLVLARRTTVTEQQLRDHWTWGRRFSITPTEEEQQIIDCYPNLDAVSNEILARRRERMTLDAFEGLVNFLASIRDERKAILTVTEGWPLFRPDHTLTDLKKDTSGRTEPIPQPNPVGIGPGGRLTTEPDPRTGNTNDMSKSACNAERMRMAEIDDEQFLRDIINQANRSNTSFYPIDPRGLPAFDTPVGGPGAVNSLAAESASMHAHRNSMRDLASGTDGLAAMDSNDLDKMLQRVSEDLTSYYLLSYYSTNAKLDGGFRSIKVRVKRPGVDVRARRGYRAATADEISKARSGAAAPEADATAPLQAALGMLAGTRPDARLRLYATMGSSSDRVWIAGELAPAAGHPDEWGQGATTELQVVAGGASATARVSLKPGERSFLTSVALAPGDRGHLEVNGRASTSGDAAPASERITVPHSVQPLFYRRGPTTANKQQVTADLRFTRADRVHVELPVAASAQPGAGRLLDRTGHPLDVPVTVSSRIDADTGQHWLTADLALAPLAPADYVIEVGSTDNGTAAKVLTGLRVGTVGSRDRTQAENGGSSAGGAGIVTAAPTGALERPVHQQGLEEEPREALVVGVQAEGVPAVQPLRHVAGEHRGEEGSGELTQRRLLAAIRHDERRPDGNFGDAGVDHGVVDRDRHPVRDLRAELTAEEREVANAGSDEYRAAALSARRAEGLLPAQSVGWMWCWKARPGRDARPGPRNRRLDLEDS